MRLRSVLLIVATAPWALGCFALDLVDDGMEEMERYSGPETKESTPADSATTAKQEDKPTVEDLRRWWKSATTLGPTRVDSGVVQCEIRGAVQFTTRTDCLTRGGRVVKRGS